MTIEWVVSGHTWLGWAVIVACGLAGLIGLGYHFLRRPVDQAFKWMVTACVVGAVTQVALGLVLFADDREPGTIHMFYGFVILLTLTFIYIYRVQFERRPTLYWGLALLFMMGLGLRGISGFGSSF
ncbi:MAG: hypothetical protein F4Y75_05635 [Acidimicrobiia bacterium]|nr:hypothetical protein [bacterium]MXX64382.1 hypothetical protein [Acidimicrobiia bacterium]MCY3580449.1 hypothetical protein [bacterium]MCY3651961.1 hypothetical protein [bacterium]MDE0644229.1 hypothetical protein [bacterium]